MKWLRGISRAIGMGLAWAIAWGSAGLFIELIWARFPGLPLGYLVGHLAEAITIPGFFAGVIFYGALRIAASRLRFDEISVLRCAASGAMSGLFVGVFLVSAGLAGSSPFFLRVLTDSVFIGCPTLLSVMSACAWLALVRIAKHFRGDLLETATK